jgi:drug/metabolite transporter (DMT)-like permease
MGVLLGLATSFAWGSADFIARFASRTIGALRIAFYLQLFGFLFLTLILLPWNAWGHLFDHSGWHPWAWGALIGVLNAVAMFALYRAFEFGKLSVVGPLSSSYPALTLVLAFFAGERLTIIRIIGVASAFGGALLVARGETTGASPSATAKKGIVWAAIAAVLFGVMFWLLGTRVIPATGPYATVWLMRGVAALVTVAILKARRLPLALPDAKTTAQAAGTGLLDTGAFVLSNLSMQIEQVSVVTVLASLYGAVTVFLAAVFLRERMSRPQWLGIFAIFAGIFLISR